MKIGLIDLDNTGTFPNLALMKISAYHKNKNDLVEWYQPMFGGAYDIVYVSKVFSWSKDYPYIINSKKIIYGGVGYGLENKLPKEIENTFPDYELYKYVKNEAYGFLTRGCPRNCDFCNVSQHQGKISKKVADLKNFWNGQKTIKLLDPNILACKDWKELFQQLIDSKAKIDFTQGLDVRLLTEEKIKYLNKMKIQSIHFAWDNADEKTFEYLEKYRKLLKFDKRQLKVYMLVNFNTTLEQDLDRIYRLRKLDYVPYVMRFKDYNCKNPKLQKGDIYNKIAKWCNQMVTWIKYETLEEFIEDNYKK